MPETELFQTGVPGFDTILGGGLPSSGVTIVAGNPGSGKTVLASQVAFAQAAAGRNVIIATVTSEPHEKLLSELAGFSFFDASRVGNEIFLVSAYPYLKKSPREAREVLVESVRARRAQLLFIDGLRALRDLWRDEAMLRDFLYELGVGLQAAGCVGLYTSEYAVQTLIELPEGTTVDGIISLSSQAQGVARPRKIEVVKLRGRAHLRGEHAMRICDDGIRVTPRIETWASPADRPARPKGRAPFGVPGVDELLHGGVPVGSQTLLAGSTGMGKSLLGLHFAAAGAAAGERALVVSFQEPPESLIERALSVGLDVRPLLERGSLEIMYRPPVELDADELVSDVLGSVERVGAGRLVVDSIGDMERAVGGERRLHHYLAAFSHYLRSLGTTALFTKEVPKMAGLSLDFTGNPLAVISQNLVFLRAFERGGRMHRGVSVLKMAASSHDVQMRGYEITGEGFRIGDTVVVPPAPRESDAGPYFAGGEG